MTPVVAHNIYDEKIWEVKQDGKKIGFLQITPRGYTLSIKNRKEQFKNLQDLQIRHNLTFNKNLVIHKNNSRLSYDYPCDTKPFNEIWDASRGVPIYTKSKKSKSYFCAGYYSIDGVAEKCFCPKKITLERNTYHGPFKTEKELDSFLKSLGSS